MAVPFHVPDSSQPATRSSPSAAPSSTAVSSTTSSGSTPQTPQPQNPNGGGTAQPSPLLAPVNNEFLVQAFCEALCRYSRVQGGSPDYSMTTPPSPSCNGNGDVFFNFNDLRNPQSDDTNGSPSTPRRHRSHSLSLPTTRERLTSQGHEMTDDDDDSTDENYPEPANFIHDHHIHLTLRDDMQEFSGHVPTRKRKKESENAQQDSNKPKVRKEKRFFVWLQAGQESTLDPAVSSQQEPKFAWPLFALGVIAVGCGLLASR